MKIEQWDWVGPAPTWSNWVVKHGSGKHFVEKVFNTKAEAKAYLASVRATLRQEREQQRRDRT